MGLALARVHGQRLRPNRVALSPHARLALRVRALAHSLAQQRRVGQAQPGLVRLRLSHVRRRIHAPNHVGQHERLRDSRSAADALAQLQRASARQWRRRRVSWWQRIWWPFGCWSTSRRFRLGRRLCQHARQVQPTLFVVH